MQAGTGKKFRSLSKNNTIGSRQSSTLLSRAGRPGAGFDVHALEGGGEAMEMARTVTPDLVLLDLSLPDLDGWEVARRLKADSLTRRIPIIAFSGRTLQHEKVSALRAGCDVYLAKPCRPDQLLNAINKLLKLES